MADSERPKPLEYGVDLTREEVNKRLEEIREIVDEVRVKYALPVESAQSVGVQRIDPKDNKQLMDCIGVLLPMSLLGVVQHDVAENENDSLPIRVSDLQLEILIYASGFSNSGVEMLGRTDASVETTKPSIKSRLKRLFRK